MKHKSLNQVVFKRTRKDFNKYIFWGGLQTVTGDEFYTIGSFLSAVSAIAPQKRMVVIIFVKPSFMASYTGGMFRSKGMASRIERRQQKDYKIKIGIKKYLDTHTHMLIYRQLTKEKY